MTSYLESVTHFLSEQWRARVRGLSSRQQPPVVRLGSDLYREFEEEQRRWALFRWTTGEPILHGAKVVDSGKPGRDIEYVWPNRVKVSE